jgi:hypothetical protein
LIFRRDADIYFDVVTCLVFLGFCFEIFLYSVTVKNYLFSFYFYIDIISTLLLLFDMNFIANPLFFGNDNHNNTGKVITRLGKYFRLIRLIRLLKILKSSPEIEDFEETHVPVPKEKKSGVNFSFRNSIMRKNFKSLIEKKNPEKSVVKTKTKKVKSKARDESRVAKKMKELTSRKLVILMLLMLIFVPLMDLDNFVSNEEQELQSLNSTLFPFFEGIDSSSPDE